MDAVAAEGFEDLARQIILDVGPMIDGGGFPSGRAFDMGGGVQAVCFLADMNTHAVLWRVRLWAQEWMAQVEATTDAGQDRMFGSVDGILPTVMDVGGARVNVVGDGIGAEQWISAHKRSAAALAAEQMEALRKRKNYEQVIVYGLAAIGVYAVLRWLF